MTTLVSTTPATLPQSLTFPRSTFAKLSPGPFLHAHLSSSSSANTSPTRPNGRTPHVFRPIHVNTSSLTHTHGSAVVRIGDTAVVCGVRGEVLLAKAVPLFKISRETSNDAASVGKNGKRSGASGGNGDGDRGDADIDIKALDLLTPNVELATGCSPNNLPGSPPSTLAMSLAARLRESLYSTKMINQSDLVIWHHPPPTEQDPVIAGAMDVDTNRGVIGEAQEQQCQQREIKAFWALYIDILFISLDGNPFDAAWAAVMAALHDTKVPRAWWDADREIVLCSDVISEMRPLRMERFVVALSGVVFKAQNGQGGKGKKEGKSDTWILIDPDAFEEGLCEEGVTVMVDCAGGNETVVGVSKFGGVGMGREELREVVRLARERWVDVRSAIKGSE